jgi:hypothetical protein
VVARHVGFREGVQARGAAVGQVQPAALAEPGAAAAGRPAGGLVIRYRAASDGEGRGPIVVQAAAEAIAAVGTSAAGAADGLIIPQRAAADGKRGAHEVSKRAPQAIRSSAARATLAADGLVTGERAARNDGEGAM